MGVPGNIVSARTILSEPIMAVKLQPDDLIDVQATGECGGGKPKKLISVTMI
mgnify:FL=1